MTGAGRDNAVIARLVSAAAALAIAAIYFWLATKTYLLWAQPRSPIALAAAAYGLIACTAALGAWLSERRRTRLYLGASLGLSLLLLQQYAPIALAYVALVIWLSRARWPLALRMVLVVGLWIAVPFLKFWVESATARSMFCLFLFWSSLAFSGPYLLVERRRGLLDKVGLVDDALYLLAPPRFLAPFVQAISPAKFHASAQAPSIALAGRAVGLALYGGALQVAMKAFPLAPPGSTHPRPEWLAWVPVQTTNGLFAYAANAAGIFCGIALLRALGFDLGSGFNWPLLSRSFGEFFRRWNYYVYEGVVSLFLYPLLGRLRTFMPQRLALIVATYLAIYCGSYVLMNVLGPLALYDPAKAVKNLYNPATLGIYAIYWTGIVLPQLGIFDWMRPKGPPSLGRRVFQHVTFILLIVTLIAAAFDAGVYIL